MRRCWPHLKGAAPKIDTIPNDVYYPSTTGLYPGELPGSVPSYRDTERLELPVTIPLQLDSDPVLLRSLVPLAFMIPSCASEGEGSASLAASEGEESAVMSGDWDSGIVVLDGEVYDV